MVIVIISFKLLVLGTQVGLFEFGCRALGCPLLHFPMFNLGQNTSAKVTLFCVLYKYFFIKMHKKGWFVPKKEYLCRFFLE